MNQPHPQLYFLTTATPNRHQAVTFHITLHWRSLCREKNIPPNNNAVRCCFWSDTLSTDNKQTCPHPRRRPIQIIVYQLHNYRGAITRRINRTRQCAESHTPPPSSAADAAALHKIRGRVDKRHGLAGVVGVKGFEPSTPCSQSRCANRTALRPEFRPQR